VANYEELAHCLGFGCKETYYGGGDWPSLSAPCVCFCARLTDHCPAWRTQQGFGDSELVMALYADGIGVCVETRAFASQPLYRLLLSSMVSLGDGLGGLELENDFTTHILTAPVQNKTPCANANVSTEGTEGTSNCKGVVDGSVWSVTSTGQTVLLPMRNGNGGIGPSDQVLLMANGQGGLTRNLTTARREAFEVRAGGMLTDSRAVLASADVVAGAEAGSAGVGAGGCAEENTGACYCVCVGLATAAMRDGPPNAPPAVCCCDHKDPWYAFEIIEHMILLFFISLCYQPA